MSTPRMEGRLKLFRLSDVPLEIRLEAATRCAAHERRRANNQLDAIFEVVKIEAVAQDPVAASEAMPDECRNEPRLIEADEWERVVGMPP